jgi:hypothetical protein
MSLFRLQIFLASGAVFIAGSRRLSFVV